jgi:hypothetical protein
MTATARLFREVLADRALGNSAIEEARQIVVRAGQEVERYKAETAQRAAQTRSPSPQAAPASSESKR